MTRRNGVQNGTNGSNGNGRNGKNGKNGNGHGKHPASTMVMVGSSDEIVEAESEPDSTLVRTEAFDQPIILQQTNLWSRAILWGLIGVTTFGVVWASVAKIEEAVPAVGQLKPEGQVQPVQAPVGGVVESLFVKEGQRVKRGDLLMRFDPTAAMAQRKSLEQVRTSLMRENQFYRSQLSGVALPTGQDGTVQLSPEMLSLTANRAALSNENRLYRAQLNGTGGGFTAEELNRIQAGITNSSSQADAARLEVAQLQQQLSQTQAELASARSSLAIDQDIYDRLKFLSEEGGVSQLQFLRQEQQLIESKAQVDKLTQELQRIQYGIGAAQEKFQSTVANSQSDLLDRIAVNDKQMADIDSQLNKRVVENEQRIADINSQLSQAEVTLKYQELRAPVDGVVFDLKAKGQGFVANSSEPILQIVPADSLVAEVYVTNQDIGFIREGMPVDVRIDSFPFSEFGDIKGELVRIGSDALPPDQEHQFYRFPVKVKMDRQSLITSGRELPLQSGMSVTTNIITRKRTVMSIFMDNFTRTVESLETVR